MRILIAIIFLLPPLAFACVAERVDYSKNAILSNDNVFMAEVIDKSYDPNNPEHTTTVKLKVTESFKGPRLVGDIVSVNVTGGSCGIITTVGRDYFFFYKDSQKVLFQTNSLNPRLPSKTILVPLLNELRSVNQALKAQPSAAGDAASGAP